MPGDALGEKCGFSLCPPQTSLCSLPETVRVYAFFRPDDGYILFFCHKTSGVFVFWICFGTDPAIKDPCNSKANGERKVFAVWVLHFPGGI